MKYRSKAWMAKIRRKRGKAHRHRRIKLGKNETYIQAYDQTIERRVPHVVRHGVAYSLASKGHFKVKKRYAREE